MNLTPREIVKELDKYIIGQDGAKRAVAVALRNRYRRSGRRNYRRICRELCKENKKEKRSKK